jgi:hypothetical protein
MALVDTDTGEFQEQRLAPTLSVTGQDSNAMFKKKAMSLFVSVACFRDAPQPARTD